MGPKIQLIRAKERMTLIEISALDWTLALADYHRTTGTRRPSLEFVLTTIEQEIKQENNRCTTTNQ